MVVVVQGGCGRRALSTRRLSRVGGHLFLGGRGVGGRMGHGAHPGVDLALGQGSGDKIWDLETTSDLHLSLNYTTQNIRPLFGVLWSAFQTTQLPAEYQAYRKRGGRLRLADAVLGLLSWTHLTLSSFHSTSQTIHDPLSPSLYATSFIRRLGDISDTGTELGRGARPMQ